MNNMIDIVWVYVATQEGPGVIWIHNLPGKSQVWWPVT